MADLPLSCLVCGTLQIKKRTRTLFRKELGSSTNCLVEDGGLEPRLFYAARYYIHYLSLKVRTVCTPVPLPNTDRE